MALKSEERDYSVSFTSVPTKPETKECTRIYTPNVIIKTFEDFKDSESLTKTENELIKSMWNQSLEYPL